MKLIRTKEWWIAKAKREGDAAVGAGLLALDPMPERHPMPVPPPAPEESRIAFGRFVNLMRRRLGCSVEKLAADANLDIGELVSIEEDLHYRAEPRVVFRLAQPFGVSQQRLFQLAGLATANDENFRQAAVRFAARSESVQKLSSEEKAALESFVAVLSDQQASKKAP